MRLLIITQKVDMDDPILGFFHRWIIEFARHCESVIVICLEKGRSELPANVRVLSLGKENKRSRFQYISRFYSYIWKERHSYDAVWVHMNQIYVILGALIWKMLGKKIALWYTHKSVTSSLRLAEKIVDRVFSASLESFRLPSKKLLVTGHGIDVDELESIQHDSNSHEARLITVGRISETKDIGTIIDAASMLKTKGKLSSLTIVGGPIYSNDKMYEKAQKLHAEEKKISSATVWTGPLPYREVIPYLKNSNIFVNASKTGSLDKAGLEAIAAGLLLITSNEGFATLLDGEIDTCMFKQGDAADLAVKLEAFAAKSQEEKNAVIEKLQEKVRKEHSLSLLIPKMLDSLY